MSYYIKVDHSKFSAAATAVETYRRELKEKMHRAEDQVENLCRVWRGADAGQFMSQWDKVTASGSTYAEMIKTLDAYSQYLSYAAGKYKDAQIKAVNRANNLPRW